MYCDVWRDKYLCEINLCEHNLTRIIKLAHNFTVNDYILYCFQVPQIPTVLESDRLRYYILYNEMARTFYPGNNGGSDSVEQEKITYSITLTSLTRDTEYVIRIRAEVEYSPCSTFVTGNYSDSVTFRTNATSEWASIISRNYLQVEVCNFCTLQKLINTVPGIIGVTINAHSISSIQRLIS